MIRRIETILPLTLVLTLGTMLLAVTADAGESSVSPARAASDLIRRIVPAVADQFAVEVIRNDHGDDVFEIENRGGKILLRGNNAGSLASALNWYLKNECHCDFSWNDGDQLTLPAKLPPVPEVIHFTSPHRVRYAYNFCTYGYTMAWWNWPKWEHELDFLALNGINMALNIEGQESVWINTFANFGYTADDVRRWVVDPAHLPWMEMDNMESYGGPLSPQLVARRLELGQKITARMRELGIAPVLPGYYGMVPPDFQKKFPAANVHIQGDWAHLKRPDILDPADPVFAQVAAAFYAAQKQLFGGAGYYDADPFHEGGTTKNIDIPTAGRAIQRAMGDATWMLQSWQANPHQEMVDALDKRKTLVLDLYCEDHENWRERTNFNGAPWVWCAINCFGGNMKTGGRLAWMSEGPDNALTDPAKGRMIGIGALMESTGVNPALWEMLLENSWRPSAPNLDDWLKDYARRRYGTAIPAAEQSWKNLAETVFNAPPPRNEHTVKSAVSSRPVLQQPKAPTSQGENFKERPVTKPYYDTARVAEAWRLLLSAAPEAGASDGYRFDLCDVGRQVLADLGTRYNQQIVTAFKAGNAVKLKKYGDKMLGLIRDMDELAGTRREWLLGTWLADARTWGTTPAEQDLCERNARELLTTWTSFDNIPDYANRQWNGLLGDFYYHRWAMWLDALNNSLATHATFHETATRDQIRDWELLWTRQTNTHFAAEPRGDAIAISQKLFEKYAAEAAQPEEK